jgi:membrane protease YdiL (CAAX protease family)
MLFPAFEPSNTLRLTAVITTLTLLLTFPAWFAFRVLMETLIDDPSELLERVSLGGELIGYAVLALAAVGFMVRRDLRASLDRLGIRSVPAGHLMMIALGVIALFALNTGAEWLQRLFFPDLWERDQRFNEALAATLSPARVLMLGLSAGIGEEITLRGALQPKLGLFMTSLLFACLHVQYSWFGMLVIFALGLVLGTIRMKGSTSVAIAVHAAYDVLAVLSVQML